MNYKFKEISEIERNGVKAEDDFFSITVNALNKDIKLGVLTVIHVNVKITDGVTSDPPPSFNNGKFIVSKEKFKLVQTCAVLVTKIDEG